MDVKIEESWKFALKDEFSKAYFADIKAALITDKKEGIHIYPPGPKIFNAFDSTPLPEVKVVIIGQDPYHGPGQAHGLCFSVDHGVKAPPSLVNIFKEIKSDLNIDPPNHGNLQSWADQGVFLLNAMLTVRAHQAASHQKIGWQKFTNAAIRIINDQLEGVVFLLWGKFAQNKANIINPRKHHILKAAHPSPFSAYNGFFGCKHFSKTNELLKAQGKMEIDWGIS